MQIKLKWTDYPAWSTTVQSTGTWKVVVNDSGSSILYLEIESANKWLRWTGLTRRWVHEDDLHIDCTTTYINRKDD